MFTPILAVTLAQALTTIAVVVVLSAVLWVGGRVLRSTLPQQIGELVGQLIPVLILATVVVGVLILIDPDQADLLLESTIRSIPRVMVALVVVIIARALGRILGLFIETALRRVSALVANRARITVSAVVLGIGVVIALQQIGVSTDIILILVAALAFGAALTVALAIGLGSRPMARQIAAGRHVQNRYEPGQRIRVGLHEGTIEQIGLVSTRLATEEGRVIDVPNEEFVGGAVTVEA